MAQSARRPVPHRIIAVFLAIFFLLAGAREGIAGYVCAKHAGHDHAAAGHAGHADRDHGEHEHGPPPANQPGEHGGHGQLATAAHDHGAGHGHDPADPCNCVGDCQPVQTSARSETERPAHEVYFTPSRSLPATAATRLPGAPKFLLPYSNGPPLLG